MILLLLVYCRKGLKRKLVSYCNDSHPAIITAKDVHVVDWKYYGYFEILEVIKNSARAAATSTATISFDDAVRKAYSLNENLKQYLDSFSRANHTPLFDNKNYSQSGSFATRCSMKSQKLGLSSLR
jgi:hypothetical protein